MGGVVRGIGAAVAGSVGAVAGAGIGNAFGGEFGSVVGAGIGSIVGSGIGSVVGGLGSTTGAAGPLVSWSVPANTSETIVSLQQVSIPAVLLAVYRIANTGAANGNAGGSVMVQTDNGPFALKPGATIDVSTQTITISSGDQSAHGTYQLLGNALVGIRGA